MLLRLHWIRGIMMMQNRGKNKIIVIVIGLLIVIIGVIVYAKVKDSGNTDTRLESTVKGHSYISEGATFILELKEDGAFTLYDATSSSLTDGETPDRYDCEDNRVILRYANGEYVTFTFEDGKLIYQEKDSTYELPFRSTLEDGAVFTTE